MANSLYAPGVSINVQTPDVELASASTSLAGVIGTAAFGPVGVAVPLSDPAGAASAFGNGKARKHDLVTLIQAAAINGGSNFMAVRVTDGTDAAATGVIGATGNQATISALWTGSGGNAITVSLAAGARASTVNAIVSMGSTSEAFSGLPTTGFWAAFTSAVNAGTGVSRGPSNLIRIAVGTATTVPTLPATVTLSGGVDGNDSITSSQMLAGLSALAGSGVQVAAIADLDDVTVASTQTAWGEANGCLMVMVEPAGQTPSSAVTVARTAAVDSYEGVLLVGDWPTVNDDVAGLRKISPQGAYIGLRSSLQPNQSVLNKPMSGIATTERMAASAPYATADIDSFSQMGIEVISQGLPRGGSAYGCRVGLNTSSNPAIASDQYSAMTNFLRQTLKVGLGAFVGEPNDDDTRKAVKAAIGHFLGSLVLRGVLANTSDGKAPFAIKCDATNNPVDQAGLGYLRADVSIQYEGIVRQFNINLKGGATVEVSSDNVQSF